MLSNSDAVATIAVKDARAARKFYEDTLGLTPLPEQEDGVLSFSSGDSTILVYESQYAGTNKATAATFVLPGDLEGTVQELRGKGVRFEHYEMPDLTRKGDIYENGRMKVAWFKDPDGNILSIVNAP